MNLFIYVLEVCAPSSERCRLYAVGRASRPSAAPIPPATVWCGRSAAWRPAIGRAGWSHTDTCDDWWRGLAWAGDVFGRGILMETAVPRGRVCPVWLRCSAETTIQSTMVTAALVCRVRRVCCITAARFATPADGCRVRHAHACWWLPSSPRALLVAAESATPDIGGRVMAILPNRDATRDASGAQNPSSLSKPMNITYFQQAVREVQKCGTQSIHFLKAWLKSSNFFLKTFCLSHSLFGNKDEKSPTFRRPPRANQRRATPHCSTLIGYDRELLLFAVVAVAPAVAEMFMGRFFV